MSDKPRKISKSVTETAMPAAETVIRESDDGFPSDKDVSKPPPASDVKTGRHKKPPENLRRGLK